MGPAPEAVTKKDFRRRRSGLIAERANAVKPLEDRIGELEDEIDRAETELSKLHAKMQAASSSGDGERIGEISQGIYHCQSRIDEAFDALERLTATLEEKRAKFDRKIEALDAIRPF